MPEAPDHGTRCRYQAGCHCLLCKAAEATYRQQLRTLQAKGRTPLGTTLSAKEAGAIIRALLTERYRRRQILDATGLEYHTLPRLNASTRCRLATVLRLRRAARILLGENPLGTHDTDAAC